MYPNVLDLANKIAYSNVLKWNVISIANLWVLVRLQSANVPYILKRIYTLNRCSYVVSTSHIKLRFYCEKLEKIKLCL